VRRVIVTRCGIKVRACCVFVFDTQLTRCTRQSEGAVLLGKALIANKQSLLTHIDVSHNPIGDRGLLGLIDGMCACLCACVTRVRAGFRSLTHTLHVLRVADCTLTHKVRTCLLF
jgi:hypothetical protein